MSRYQNIKINVSDDQREKIKHAVQSGSYVTIRLAHADLNGDHVLALTNAQINKMKKAYESGKG